MLSQIKAHQSIIITGGNSGLGYQCAKAIAQSNRGWQIIIASRNLHRVESAVSRLITETNYPHIQGLELDLASLQSVRRFVQQLTQLHIPLAFPPKINELKNVGSIRARQFVTRIP